MPAGTFMMRLAHPGLLVASLVLPVRACTAEDILALTALFFATGGPGWRAVDPTVDIHAHWMQGDACCTWPGISCNKRQEVRKIKLGSSLLNVRGTLPSDLYLLHSLKEVSLKRCAPSHPRSFWIATLYRQATHHAPNASCAG